MKNTTETTEVAVQAEKQKKSVGSRIVSTVLNIICVFVILVLILSAYTFFKYKDNPRDAFILGYRPMLVETGSMEKTLLVNSIIVIKKVPYDSIEVDDIITVAIDNIFVTHRVVEITPDGLLTKGDNNRVMDTFISNEENLVGKEVATFNWIAPILTQMQEDFKSPKGMVVWVIVPFVLLVLICSIVMVAKKMFSKNQSFREKGN